LPQIGLIIAIGGYAHRWHLGPASIPTVQRTVEDWRTHAAHPQPVFALPHPSWRNTGWLNRNPWFETELLPVLQSRVRAHLV
jgi:uracil-DNA glycosylase